MRHFDQRCIDRGIKSADPAQIRAAIEYGVANYETDPRAADFLEPVRDSYGMKIWRFRVPEGIYYAVISPTRNKCVTVLTQEYFSINRRREKIRSIKSKSDPDFDNT